MIIKLDVLWACWSAPMRISPIEDELKEQMIGQLKFSPIGISTPTLSVNCRQLRKESSSDAIFAYPAHFSQGIGVFAMDSYE